MAKKKTAKTTNKPEKQGKTRVQKTRRKETLKPSVDSKQKKSTVKTKETSTITSREKSIQGIKQNLLLQREALLKEAEETLNALPGEQNFPDMSDQATAETDRSFMLRLRGRESGLLKKIDDTIENINNGIYGNCEICANKIGIKRLKARPVTTLCIDCKTQQEEEERIAGAS